MFIGISRSAKVWGQEVAKDVLVMGWVVGWSTENIHTDRDIQTHTYIHSLGTVGAKRLTHRGTDSLGEGSLL